ncbi:MAG: hypothetical protein ABSA01_05490 [Anaerolineales bacterium]|jgi:hypothetical protein
MHLTTAVLFLFLIIFCVGAAVGGVIERALKNRSNPPPFLPPSNKNILAEADDVEVLSAWRTHSNKVWLGMDGARLNDKAELQPGQYQRLVSLVLDLRPWLETAQAATPKPESSSEPLPPVAPVPALTQPPVLAVNKKVIPVIAVTPPAPVLDSIIQQIDKVLQTKLETSPFKDRGIQLVEGAGGIVIVKDGVKSYEGVDAIPDPEIRTLIRQAVTDWEKSTK